MLLPHCYCCCCCGRHALDVANFVVVVAVDAVHKIRMIMMLKLAECVCVAESVFYEQIKIAIISEN